MEKIREKLIKYNTLEDKSTCGKYSLAIKFILHISFKLNKLGDVRFKILFVELAVYQAAERLFPITIEFI